MSNLFLAWQNRVDEGTLSGGSWLSTLPLTNLQNRQVQKVARSTDAAVASTQFQLDLGAARSISAVALILHNISVSGEVRVQGAESSAAFTNLITGPRNFNNAAWVKSNVTAAVDTGATSPDGTATPSRLTATTTGATSIYQAITATATTHTHTAFVKRGSGATSANRFAIYNATTGITLLLVSVNYDTGEITYAVGTTGATIAAVGDGWWKLTLQVTAGITIGNTLHVFDCFTGLGETAGTYALIWDSWMVAGVGASYDSGWTPVWPVGVIPTDRLNWEDDNFWLGQLSQDARASYQSPYICKLPFSVVARYWRVEISDTTNPAGYVQAGRLFIGFGWSPTVNYAYDWDMGYQDPTPVDVSLSGAEYFDVRPKYRMLNFSLEYITETEAQSYVLEMQRVSGISGEVLAMPDGGDDVSQQPLISFVGRMRQLGKVRQPNPTAYAVDFEIKELL